MALLSEGISKRLDPREGTWTHGEMLVWCNLKCYLDHEIFCQSEFQLEALVGKAPQSSGEKESALQSCQTRRQQNHLRPYQGRQNLLIPLASLLHLAPQCSTAAGLKQQLGGGKEKEKNQTSPCFLKVVSLFSAIPLGVSGEERDVIPWN